MSWPQVSLGLGGLGQGQLQLLELYRRFQSISCLATLPFAVKSLLNISLDGDDVARPWHLQDHVAIIWDLHELGECRPSQESIARSLEIGDLKLYSLCAEIFLSPEGHGESDLADGGCYCNRDYAIKRSPTEVQQRHG
jgi:hypothetical protein